MLRKILFNVLGNFRRLLQILILGKPYRFLEHTADIRAEVEGMNFVALVRNGIQMLRDAMGGRKFKKGREEIAIDVQAPTEEELLVSCLNEALFQFATKKFLSADFKLYELNRWRIRGVLIGRNITETEEELLSELKSVTYHGLKIKRTWFGLRVQLVVDV